MPRHPRPADHFALAVALVCLCAGGCARHPAASHAPGASPSAVAKPGAPGGPVVGNAGAAAAPATPAPEVMRLGLEDLVALQASGKPPLLVDARMAVLYHLSHLPGAINLPAKRREAVYPQVRDQILAAQAAGRRVIFYCVDANCPDATHTALYVASQGVPGLLVYDGGIDEWKQAGLPLE